AHAPPPCGAGRLAAFPFFGLARGNRGRAPVRGCRGNAAPRRSRSARLSRMVGEPIDLTELAPLARPVAVKAPLASPLRPRNPFRRRERLLRIPEVMATRFFHRRTGGPRRAVPL